MPLDRLRSLVDWPALQQVLDAEAAGTGDPGALLGWYDRADRSVGQEVAAGRATAAEAQALQDEVFALMAPVPGLQFVTDAPFGQPPPEQ